MATEYRDLRLSAGASSFEQTHVAGDTTGNVSVASSLLDSKQVARLLHVSESWVREHCNGKEPRLPAMKLGQGRTALVRFHLNDIEEFIRGHRDRARSRATPQRRW
jgi:hypothetical protein